MRGFSLTQGTRGLVREPPKQCGLVGAFPWWFAQLGWLLRCASALAGPDVGQHDAYPQELQDRQVVEEKVRNHDMAPLPSGVTGAYYRVSGVGQLSAA